MTTIKVTERELIQLLGAIPLSDKNYGLRSIVYADENKDFVCTAGEVRS